MTYSNQLQCCSGYGPSPNYQRGMYSLGIVDNTH